MRNWNDRSDAALQKRLELAKKATHGPWALWEWDNGVKEIRSNADPDEDHVCRVWHKKDGDFLAKNSPREVQADIEEILRLRAENERLELENQRLSVDGVNGEAYLLTCLDIIRRAVGMPVGSDWQQVAERVERLNKEADWLVKMLSLYTEDCPLKFSWVYAEKLPIPKIDDCEGTWSVDDCFHCSGRNSGQCWREAASKAVQEKISHE